MQDTPLTFTHASIHNICSLLWLFARCLTSQCFFRPLAVLETVAATEAYLSLTSSDNLRCLAHALIPLSADYFPPRLLGRNPCTSPVFAVILEVNFYEEHYQKFHTRACLWPFLLLNYRRNSCLPTCRCKVA